ncbi:branched-chain amino acid ABC transporter permease [Desulfosarcina ovata]|uniref:Branched-chain amino acid ABC transporter permease n=1 Tax=Desulfosarcina ovata subsp. ovata TaxID=2752305 RepID=A0A5K8A3S8_9BACT|nr:branched-chain amino acid ABC transporter permease [Desulfosarcina ovata]BBO87202.1 branched-chain amino acid ABC transporter permease [Desulfosarcina ovata subsp. ovata]
MEYFLEVLINGVLTGGLYGVTAIGLTLIFGVIKVINFAHGTYLMIAMYAAYGVCVGFGMDPYLSMILIVPFSFAVGYVSQVVFVTPCLKAEKDVREPVSVLLLTAGLWIFVNNLFLMLFGANFRSLQTPYSGAVFEIGNMMISRTLLYAFCFSVLTTALLTVFLKKTNMGRAIRAVGQDREAAGLMGINIFKVYNVAFGIGIATLGVAGAIIIPMFYVHPFAGDVYDMRDFVIVVLGGLGSVPGALLGGIIVGVVESFAGEYLNMSWAAGIIYIIFLLTLFLRPQGIFGFEKDS